ncbi:MAG: nicotinate (nicotinamide) nucleotide adenylyltransferase [Bacilli bacterium]|nr:nicotinate (nicotinamide) nucleotide adenylyltransferase [Bacilli bacterium]
MKKILFGGAFDPIHNGHINMALSAAKQIGGEVIFIPSKVSVWKTKSVDAKSKKEMVELAIKDYDCFSMSDFELTHKDNFVYSILTVRHFAELYPNDELYFLMGGDQANKFHLWSECETIAKLSQILVFPRKNEDFQNDNIKRFNMKIIDGVQRSDASMNIRRFKEIDSPYPVIEYIEKNNLYYIPRLKEWYGKRYNHVSSVADLCYRIAKANGYDAQKAYIAGFLHDLGKMVDLDDESKDYSAEKTFIDYELNGAFRDLPKYAVHQVSGVYYAKKDYEIDDEEILNAILWHCTGRDNMTWIEKIVYAADKIDPTRGYDSSKLIEAMMNDVESGFITVLKANMEYINSKANKASDNIYTEKCVNYYLK